MSSGRYLSALLLALCLAAWRADVPSAGSQQFGASEGAGAFQQTEIIEGAKQTVERAVGAKIELGETIVGAILHKGESSTTPSQSTSPPTSPPSTTGRSETSTAIPQSSSPPTTPPKTTAMAATTTIGPYTPPTITSATQPPSATPAGSAFAARFNFTNGAQSFIAPTTGNYSFTVAGGQGGDATGARLGGLGATVRATAFLLQGANVTIIVAGQGISTTANAGAGGGGLSAVYTNGTITPTIVAGGGGGASPGLNSYFGNSSTECDAVTVSPMGGPGGDASTTLYQGQAGSGGAGGGASGGGGGGTVGPASSTYLGGLGQNVGFALYTGGDGGYGAGGGGGGVVGGFRGGGGGGAGYTGGAGGTSTGTDAIAGGAGTSFLAKSVSGTCTVVAGNSGNGYVTVVLQ